MANHIWSLCVTLFAVAVIGAQGACPSSCSCTGTNVTCTGGSSIPEGIPLDVTSIRFRLFNFTTLPNSALMNFQELEYIEFSEGILRRVDSYAFTHLNTTKFFNFTRCAINHIGEFAFSGLDRIEKIEFAWVSISYIDSYAFSDISYLGIMTFYKTSIEDIRQMAIHRIGYLGVLGWYSSGIMAFHGKSVSDIGDLGTCTVVGSYVETIHPEAFFNLTKVGIFDIVRSTVLEIKEYAITKIGYVGILGLAESLIKSMRSFAISNNYHISMFSCYRSKLDVIESFAISQNEQIDSFNLLNTTIEHLNSYAFNDISIDAVLFENLNFGKLDCGTIEHLQDTVNPFTLTSVHVECDPNICWLFHPNRTQYLQNAFSGVKCSTPHPSAASGLGSLYGTPSQNLPFGCNKYNYTAIFACSGTQSSIYKTLNWITLLLLALTCLLKSLGEL